MDLPHCHHESPLDLVLSRVPLCHILPSMLIRVKRPVRRFVRRDLFLQNFAKFQLLSTEKFFRFDVVALPLVPTQTSIIWVRILQHGLLSPKRLALIEQFIASIIRPPIGSKGYSKNDAFWLSSMEMILAKLNFLELAHFISFDTVREWFDMSSLKKIQPLFGICVVLIIAGICLEANCAKAVSLISAFFEALSSFCSVCVTFVG